MAGYMEVTDNRSTGSSATGRTEKQSRREASESRDSAKAQRAYDEASASESFVSRMFQEPSAVYISGTARGAARAEIFAQAVDAGKETVSSAAGKAEPQNGKKAEKTAGEKTEAELLQEALEKNEAAMKEEEAKRYQEMLEKYREDQLSFFENLIKQMREQRKKWNDKKGSKSVNYNYRRVSNIISRAKTSTQASLALSSATSAVAMIRRQAASGEYKSREIEAALQHAQKMVRIARKKISNMKQESYHKKKDDTTLRGVKKKPKARKIPVEAKRQQKIFELEKELLRRQEQRKNVHRRNELMELTSADLAFLKSKIRELKQEEYHSSDFRMDGIAAEGFSAVLGGEAATESAAEVAQDGMASQEAAEAGGMESGGDEAAAGGSFDAMA